MTTPVYVETASRHSGATRIRAPAARGRLALGTIVAWLLALLWPRTAPAADPFAVVLLPDTQQYTISSSVIDHFEAQTQWIVDNADVRNIVFATLVGDIVEHASLALEWNRALGAMDTLDGNLGQNPDGLLPHAAVAGNHDYDVSGVKGAATQYLLHFGPGHVHCAAAVTLAQGAQGRPAQLFGHSHQLGHIELQRCLSLCRRDQFVYLGLQRTAEPPGQQHQGHDDRKQHERQQAVEGSGIRGE